MVPAIDDDGFVLSESNAILEYLGATRNWSLYPADAKTRARVHEYLHWHHANTRQITLSVFAPALRADLKIPPAVIEKSLAEASKALRTLDAWCEGSKYLVADVPTIADIAAYCEIGQCKAELCALVNFEPFPNLRRWMAECEKLPGCEQSHALLARLAPKLRKTFQKHGGARL